MTNFLDQVRAARAVHDAWTIPGPRPDIHEKAKQKLKQDWPALYKALNHYEQIMKPKNYEKVETTQ